ncbi:hypothetical protein CPB83DRAFT_784048 [Crepidotus variabilis]|uniref:NAD(P)-binding domain-containing protein n=1 Tax=Crepidotus variabilis TaxID=179855 RepID=A0A9P6EQ19_9AGAR|nr:hypothetical protein CPB83DRAFT_784048 [Crepidotus variabilis]
MSLNVLAAGASRHIGYHTSVRLLEAGATVTFLLRSPEVFDGDEVIQKYVKDGKAKLFKGDALVEDDVRSVWAEASKEQPVDLLLFTVGFNGSPSFSLTKGVQIKPANLATQCLFNILCGIPKTEPNSSSGSKLKLITLSSIGASRSARAKLPIHYKMLYGYLIAGPLIDKLGMERVAAHVSGQEWDVQGDGEPDEDIMGPSWRERQGLPAPGTLESVVIRAGTLNDGECRADNVEAGRKPYRFVIDKDQVSGSISRKDVAHFAFDLITKRWDELKNHTVNVAY